MSGNRIIIPQSETLTSVDYEQRELIQFLTLSDLAVPKNFIEGLRRGDIIEMYSVPEMKQLYCNKEFLRYCSYSPEQMQSTPFQKLFWRSDEAQTLLLERAAQISKGVDQAESWNIPPHELVESLHPRRRTFEMHMGLVSPVINLITGDHCGFASTLRVELIYEWPEAV